MQEFPNVNEFDVCDLGGSKHFWRSVDEVLRPRTIDVVNVESAALNAAGVDELGSDRFRFILYDGYRLDCEDAHYDLVLCNSVIEHVAPPDRPGLAKEMRRVARRGFVQTPAYGFPIDPHFLMPAVHWLPRSVARRVVRISPWRLLSRASRATSDRYFDETRLLRRSELQDLFPTAVVHVERWFGLPKSYVAVFGSERPTELSQPDHSSWRPELADT